MSQAISKSVSPRRLLQWSLVPIVLITIGLGWRYPILGFTVPAVMLMGMIGGLTSGRYVCGTLCPRGAFFDRLIAPISRKKNIPTFLRNMAFRWATFAAMMGFMIWRLLEHPADLMHWGRVFWLMCVVTTALGVVLGVLIHPRTWCAFCPMGTMQRALGGDKHPLHIDGKKCRECRLCEKACPFSLEIVKHKTQGRVNNPDCLKCSECAAACPTHALKQNL